MSDLEKLVIKIEGDNVNYTKALEDTARKTSTFAATASTSFANIAKSAALVSGAVLAAGTAFIAVSKSAAGMAAAIDDAANMAGIGTKALQELRYAAMMTGVDTGLLDDALRKFQVNLGEFASSGAGIAAAAFQQLGINQAVMRNGMIDTEATLEEVLLKLSQVPDGATRATLAFDIFGKSGSKLAVTLGEGEEGLKALREEAHRLGVVISDELIKKGAALDDKFEQISAMLKSQFMNAVLQNADAIADLAQALIDLIPILTKAGNLFAQFITIMSGNSIHQQAAELESLGEKIQQVQDKITKGKWSRGGPVPLNPEELIAYNQELNELLIKQEMLINRMQPQTMQAGDIPPVASSGFGGLNDGGTFGTGSATSGFQMPQGQDSFIGITGAFVEGSEQHDAMLESYQMQQDLLREHESKMNAIKAEAHQTGLGQLFAYMTEENEAFQQGSFEQQQTLMQGAASTASFLSKGLQNAAGHSKKAFTLVKALNIAMAIVEGIKAVQSAYAWGQSLGGPPLAAAFAAAAGAATLANINAIKSTNLNSGGGGISAAGRGVESPTGGNNIQTRSQASELRIVISGDDIGSDGLARVLTQAVDRAVGDGVKVDNLIVRGS